MVIFTSICANYLHKARVLAQSIRTHINDATFVVCLLEKECKPQYMHPSFDRIVLAKEMWEGNFERFIFKHSVVEASTAVKGQFFKFLYQEYTNETEFVYLDPDVYVYSDFVELRDYLKTNVIILCPHLLKPGNIDMELSSTAHGVYNLGFLAVNRSEQAQQFINWWAERLYLFCYDDIQRGIFTDQKWVDLAPCFFDVLILKHDGYDFAPWSLYKSEMQYMTGKDVFVNGFPLRFIHFSGFGHVAEKCMRDWLPEGTHVFKELYAQYSELHMQADSDSISKTIWSYNYYNSGELISKQLRESYRQNYDVMFEQENPFEHSNKYFKTIINKKCVSHNYKYGIKFIIAKYRELGLKTFIVLCWKKLLQR